MNIGRVVGVIAAVLIVVGVAVFFLFRYTFSVGRLQKVQSAVGIDTPPPERHIIVEGFRGWAVVNFGVEGSPPLEVDDGVIVVEYPASGRLQTSTLSPYAKGLLHREFFEQKGDELVPLSRLGEIWGEYNLRIMADDEGELAQRSFGFFVGTMAEFNSAERPTLGLPELPALAGEPG